MAWKHPGEAQLPGPAGAKISMGTLLSAITKIFVHEKCLLWLKRSNSLKMVSLGICCKTNCDFLCQFPEWLLMPQGFWRSLTRHKCSSLCTSSVSLLVGGSGEAIGSWRSVQRAKFWAVWNFALRINPPVMDLKSPCVILQLCWRGGEQLWMNNVEWSPWRKKPVDDRQKSF